MINNASFAPRGLSAAVDTNASAGTASSAQINASDLLLKTFPTQVRVANMSGSDVYFSITTATQTAVAPIPGTPRAERPIFGGTVEEFGLEIGDGQTTLWVNTICPSGSSSRLILTFGEGQ